jgi:type VI secretion system secreted protein VgrG
VLGSQDNIALAAHSHIDMVSAQNTQISTGNKFLLRATEQISLFVHKLGMKLIAASGKITVQAQNDNVEVTAAKKMILTSLQQINLRAPKITYIAQGAQVTLANGAITTQCTGVHTRRAGKHVLVGAAGAGLTFPVMPFSSSTEQEICSHVFDIGSMLHNDPNLEGCHHRM